MARHAAITVFRPREEVQRRWQEQDSDLSPNFVDAPGDRGTEIHVELEEPGKIAEVAGKLTGKDEQAQAMDQLRRFKQLVETGEITRSEGTPEGEAGERKLKQRPAQPLDDSELEKAGV
jgi:hypothetical protein